MRRSSSMLLAMAVAAASRLPRQMFTGLTASTGAERITPWKPPRMRKPDPERQQAAIDKRDRRQERNKDIARAGGCRGWWA